jgi:hypothetical protein
MLGAFGQLPNEHLVGSTLPLMTFGPIWPRHLIRVRSSRKLHFGRRTHAGIDRRPQISVVRWMIYGVNLLAGD